MASGAERAIGADGRSDRAGVERRTSGGGGADAGVKGERAGCGSGEVFLEVLTGVGIGSSSDRAPHENRCIRTSATKLPRPANTGWRLVARELVKTAALEVRPRR